jgi:hypothetical protein
MMWHGRRSLMSVPPTLTGSTHPLPHGESLARNRLPSIVPLTGWLALAPHVSSGSNGITMTARPS